MIDHAPLPFVSPAPDWEAVRARLGLYLDALGVDRDGAGLLIDGAIADCLDAGTTEASVALPEALAEIAKRMNVVALEPPPSPLPPSAPTDMIEQCLEPFARLRRRSAAL
jgi:hypothetical protein